MNRTDYWHVLTITINREASEAACEILYEYGCVGLAINDEYIADSTKKLVIADFWPQNSNIFDSKIDIMSYWQYNTNIFAVAQKISERIKALTAFGLQIEPFGWRLEKTYESDWMKTWRENYKTFSIGERFVIKPSWCEASEIATDRIVIGLDPGTAFGTGDHPTTKMCLLELEKIVKKSDILFDIGTGSAILSIAAAKLGCHKVVATDIDEQALITAQNNVNLNKMSNDITLIQSDLLTSVSGKANIIVANIIADAIIAIAPDVKKHLQPQGLFICCGIIEGRQEDVRNALIMSGLQITKKEFSGGWIMFGAK